MTSRPIVHRPMTGDAAWNFAALGVTASAGAALTFAIAGWLGAAVLGVFAQLYAVHVIGAQVAVFGAHDSVQKHAAELDRDPGRDAALVVSGLLLAGIAATGVALVVAIAARPVAVLVESPDVGRGLYLVAPGIVAFAMNKVLFGALNGRGELRRYAVMQMLRAAFVLAALAGVLVLALPGYAVGGIFATAELLLLPCLLAVVRPSWRGARASGARGIWWRRHVTFGGLGLVNGILLETHLRVDVAMLSYFVTDRQVGVYAFAVLFAEALYQVPVVVRTVAYPRVVQLASRVDRAALSRLARRLALGSGAITAAAALIVAAGYPAVAGRFDADYVALGAPALQVLLAGMTLYACVVPVDQLLLQSGLPGRQSALMALYVGVNVVLNLVLIPRYGLMGAAAATAASLVVSAGLLLAASWLWLGFRGSVLLYRAPAT